MITHIHIRDFAVIDGLELELRDGLSALTGETGAGKSILVDALGLVLGDRADSSVVRHGAAKTQISVTFDISQHGPATQWLSEHDLESAGECIIRRVITRDGRSKIYINGSPTTLQMVKALGEMLVDIHGQHEHQSLMRKEAQRELLDNYAGNLAELETLAGVYREWKTLSERITSLSSQGREREARIELLRFQVEELQTLDLGANEINTLEEEHARLAHAGRLLETTEAVHNALYDDDEAAAYAQLGRQIQALQGVAELDPVLRMPLELLTNAQIQLQEAATELRHYTDRVELDPERLRWVEERLSAIHDLARKHRVDVEQLRETQQQLETELSDLDGTDYDLDALRAKQEKAAAAFLKSATKVRKRRFAAARELNQGVTQAMQHLGMEGGHFEICVTEEDERFTVHGLDQIEFQVSANPGQPVQALSKVASGGELSRISLAIHLLAARGVSIPTLVFDEADTGIGGGVAEAVGRQLRQLGQSRQVLCVTHLPQVAAQAHQHYQVAKRKEKDSTRTFIASLNQNSRIEEIARMLGGLELTDQTLAHAAEMIEHAQSA